MTLKKAPALAEKQRSNASIGIVFARFNSDITTKMLESAHQTAKEENLEIAVEQAVPGSLEIPFLAKRLLKKKNIQGVVCLGAIIAGSTKHDEIIGHAIAQSLLDLSLQFDKPVGMGIIGPGATEAQAIERAEEYGRRAVLAVRQLI